MVLASAMTLFPFGDSSFLPLLTVYPETDPNYTDCYGRLVVLRITVY